MTIELKGFFLPGSSWPSTVYEQEGCRILLPRLSPDGVRQAVDRAMETAADTLPAYSADDLASIFDQTAARWREPSEKRRRISRAIAGLTGLSPEVVEASIEVEQSNCNREDILAAVNRDLGDHRCLDGFVPEDRLGGWTRAIGPKLTGAVLTSNVPGLSYLSIVRALVVKSPLVAKLSRFEPIFGPAWLETLAEVEPRLASCVAMFCWPGSDPELEEAMLEQAEALMVYGGPESIAHYRQAFGRRLRLVEHGHKVGVALIGREALSDERSAEELAQRIALDTAMFDQRACVSPQILFVERGGLPTRSFAALLHAALNRLAEELPRSATTLDTAAGLAQEINLESFAAAQDPGKEILTGAGGIVVHESEPVFQGVLPLRYLRVCPVEGLDEALEIMAPYATTLQNVGLAAEGRALELAEKLARLGASRIVAPGSMHRPSMRWKHDGLAPFASLVRWTDMEMLDSFGGSP